jgi:hypothetical protein
MKALEEKDDSYYGFSYSELIDSMEVDVLLEVDEADYQGSSWLIVQQGSRFGYLCYGWGSCSGCDALEACGNNVTEATELRDDIFNGIQWENSADELLSYFVETDWELKWEYHSKDFRDFLEQAKDKLFHIASHEIGV